mmetsp:Transcript_23411/g.51393  ORF Transcript_23411/g.51393 Transcript_23411/m.51393 type:complete len:80 (-) Transcript_23411:60-299(-)
MKCNHTCVWLCARATQHISSSTAYMTTQATLGTVIKIACAAVICRHHACRSHHAEAALTVTLNMHHEQHKTPSLTPPKL